jgi:TonB family protein
LRRFFQKAAASSGRRKSRDMKSMSAGDEFPSWEPRELGLPRALLLAILLVAAVTAGYVLIATSLAPKPRLQAIQVMQVTLAQLPKPVPPPAPPKVTPPPKPVPAVIPKPPPSPSPVVVPTKPPPPPPPPPVRHVYRPAPHPVIRRVAPARAPARPAPPAPPAAPAPSPRPATPAAPTSGIPVYGEQIYSIIQANQNVPAALSALGISGTAVIEIVVAPDGKVLSARVAKSSGVPIIDAIALDHARDAQLPPFNSEMPDRPHAFLVPIRIEPGQND